MAAALPLHGGAAGGGGADEFFALGQGDAEVVDGAVGLHGEGVVEVDVVAAYVDVGIGIDDDAGLGFAQQQGEGVALGVPANEAAEGVAGGGLGFAGGWVLGLSDLCGLCVLCG